MSQEQITILANKFSKEHGESIIAYNQAKSVIAFLLQHFYLVDKHNIDQEYERIKQEIKRIEKVPHYEVDVNEYESLLKGQLDIFEEFIFDTNE